MMTSNAAMSAAARFLTACANSQACPQPLVVATDRPCDRLEAIAHACETAVDAWSCTVHDSLRIGALAAALVDLVAAAPQVCLGMGPHLPMRSPSQRHALFVAILGIRIAETAGLDAHSLLTVAKAALTMNLPALDLQDDLIGVQPSDAQRITLSRHPLLAAELLRDTPGADLGWVEAVLQHHETLDGSGYPHALRGAAICPEARVLRLADVWCALVAPRRQRASKTPREATHWLLARSRQCFDPRFFDALRRLSGYYPPGTVVRLANRETAIVVDTPHGAAAPREVVSFLGMRGTLLRDPVRRNTRRPTYAISGYAPPSIATISTAYWNRIWSLA